MRVILDACTCISLVKAKIFEKFMTLCKDPVVIDTSVYQETVTEGKHQGFLNANEIENKLNQYKIPVISVDVEPEIKKLISAGETSCYILAREDGVCVTSDVRA